MLAGVSKHTVEFVCLPACSVEGGPLPAAPPVDPLSHGNSGGGGSGGATAADRGSPAAASSCGSAGSARTPDTPIVGPGSLGHPASPDGPCPAPATDGERAAAGEALAAAAERSGGDDAPGAAVAENRGSREGRAPVLVYKTPAALGALQAHAAIPHGDMLVGFSTGAGAFTCI